MAGKKTGLGRGLDALFPIKNIKTCQKQHKTAKQRRNHVKNRNSECKTANRRMMKDLKM